MKDFEKLGVFYLGKLAGPGAPNSGINSASALFARLP